jgi:prohibitin 2
MENKNWGELLGRLQKGGKGAGIGLGFLAAAGSAAYGLYQSMYTGTWFSFLNSAAQLHKRP